MRKLILIIFIQNFGLNFGQTCPSARGIIQDKKIFCEKYRCEKSFVWDTRSFCAPNGVETADGSCSPCGPKDWSFTESRFWSEPFWQIGFKGEKTRTLIRSKSVRMADSLPVIKENLWENENFIDSLSAWYDTKYDCQQEIEEYRGFRKIRGDISGNGIRASGSRKNSISKRTLAPILNNRTKRSDVNSICSDYKAFFNPETELCECVDGFYDTTFGCQLFENAECHPSNAIAEEILRRLDVNYDISQPLRNLFGDHSESLKTRSCNSAKKACGRSSRAANYLYYNDLRTIGSQYKTLRLQPITNVKVIIDLIHLLHSLLKKSLLNCLRGGWGYDPTDALDDVGGIQCTEGGWKDKSQRRYLKCRVKIRLNDLLNEIDLSLD